LILPETAADGVTRTIPTRDMPKNLTASIARRAVRSTSPMPEQTPAHRRRDRVTDVVSIGTSRSSSLGMPLALAVALACCAAGALGADGLLFLAPALLLAVPLLARRYPGERLLLALAARRRPRRARARFSARTSPRRAQSMPRGGLLMGFALAVRPPPLAPATS
jgi:hypothetical protein